MERYIDSPYSQHFCGEIYFQYKYPSDSSDFVHFRKRIGEDGMKKIFKQSIELFDKDFIRKRSKRGKGRYISSGEEYHLPNGAQAYGESDRTL